MNRLPAIDLAIVATFLLAVVGLGLRFARRGRDVDRYMAAGRSLPGWAVGLSMFGTYVSSISFLANPGKSYAADWNPFVFSLSIVPAAWVATRLFVPFYRRAGEISAYHHLERRFGPWARTYAVLCYLLTQMARMGTVVYLLGLALEALMGWDLPTVIVAVGFVMTTYTLLGGMEAAIWTGVFQSAVLVAGTAACVVSLLVAVPGGVPEVLRVGIEQGKFSMGGLGPSLAEPTFWVIGFYGLTINLQNFGVDQNFVQRYITARSDPDASRSVWWVLPAYLPVAAAFFFIGTTLFVLQRARPDLLPAGLAADGVFPHFIANGLPSGVKGLVVAALLAAAMDSSLNSMATVTFRDLVQRYVRPAAGEQESRWILRLSMAGWGTLGTAAALWMIGARNALDVWWSWAGILGGGMLGLFLLGLVSRKARGPDAAVALAAGIGVILLPTLCSILHRPAPFHELLAIVFGTLTVVLVGTAMGRRHSPHSSSVP